MHHFNGTNSSRHMVVDDVEDIADGDEYVFHYLSVRVALIVAYTFVFCSAFIGNVLVMAVVIVHRRMRTITNFFLTNLAFADMCVGVFCVYQNLSLYLTSNWRFGDFLCKMYHFVHSLSYTTSIAILMVICVERYIAIVHPILSKRIITMRRLRLTIAFIWLFCAGYCSPRLIMFGTIQIPSKGGGVENLCVLKRSLYDSKTYDIVNFFVIFIFPLAVMSIMYCIIGIKLWRTTVIPRQPSGRGSVTPTEMVECPSSSRFRHPHSPSSQKHVQSAVFEREISKEAEASRTRVIVQEDGDVPSNWSTDCVARADMMESQCLLVTETKVATRLCPTSASEIGGKSERALPPRNTSSAVLRSRKKVIRLLLAVVTCFAVCNLPFHARKLWQYWSPNYDGASSAAAFFTITTTLVFYLNSGINPILYAFLSDNFRKCMADLLACRTRAKHGKYSNRTQPKRSQSSWHQDTLQETTQ